MNQEKKKKQMIAAAAVTVLLLLTISVMAWLYYQRSMETATRIQEPNALMIGEGDQQEIWKMDLGNIDVNQKQQYKDIVFCVFGFEQLSYQLELAHTTNIGFTYEIFPAEKNSSGSVSDAEGMKYNETENALSGQYLNPDSSDTKIAQPTGTYHNRTYAKINGGDGSYDTVQKHAEPLYWRNTNTLTLSTQKSTTGVYIDYYILHISWDNTFQNNKETDMVYLMAERVASNG